MHGAPVDYLIIFPTLYLGLATSVQDWREGKIANRHILTGLIVGVSWLLLTALFHWMFFDETKYFTMVLPKALIAGVTAIITGFILWRFDVWAAADAKMFAVYVLLTPAAFYNEGRAAWLIAIVIMINGYIIAFAYVAADFLFRLSRMAYGKLAAMRRGEGVGIDFAALKTKLRANFIDGVKVFFGFVLVLIAVRLMRRGLQEEANRLVAIDNTTLFLALFLLFRPLHGLLHNTYIFVLTLLGVAGYLGWSLHVDPSGASTYEMLSFGALSISAIAFRHIYSWWSSLVEIRSIPIEDFRPHMVPSRPELERLRDQKVFTDDELKDFGVDGAGEEQWLRIVESRLKPKEGVPPPEQRIEVENTMPFAPFLFLGMTATIIFGEVIMRVGMGGR